MKKFVCSVCGYVYEGDVYKRQLFSQVCTFNSTD